VVEKALGPELRDRLLALKRLEWDEYRVQLSAWELDRYLPML
jgi:glutamine synthetase